MGSWNDLDAIYPPGILTPASAYLAAIGFVYGLCSVYGPDGAFHPLLHVAGLPTTADVLTRANTALGNGTDAAALVAPLHSGQRLCLALNLLDAAPGAPPEQRERRAQLLAALAVDSAVLLVAERLFAHKNDRTVFSQ